MNTENQNNKITRKIPVFVVEDNPMYSFMLTYHLEHDYNFNIFNFDSGEDCIDNIDRYRPSIVILDHKLKNLSGLNVLKHIKRNYPDIYVVVVTEQKDLQITVEFANNGADDYIQKNSVTLERLKFTITRMFYSLYN
ncbi:MAG TPA: response regulator [Bacteroidia bacterium]